MVGGRKRKEKSLKRRYGERMEKEKVKWIKVKFLDPTTGRCCKPFWVSEKNKFFEFYKNSPYYKKLKEVDK